MIKLEPYNQQWPFMYEQEKTALLKASGRWNIAIEHIGSTAVPGIHAKPIIDIMIGVSSLSVADQHLIEIYTTLGYDYIAVYEQDMPQRRYFQKNNVDKVRTHQIHLVEHGSEFWQRHLLFRNYLRANPAVAKAYAEHKLQLAPRYTDSNEYAMAKNDFIRAIENEALAEFLQE